MRIYLHMIHCNLDRQVQYIYFQAFRALGKHNILDCWHKLVADMVYLKIASGTMTSDLFCKSFAFSLFYHMCNWHYCNYFILILKLKHILVMSGWQQQLDYKNSEMERFVVSAPREISPLSLPFELQHHPLLGCWNECKRVLNMLQWPLHCNAQLDGRPKHAF